MTNQNTRQITMTRVFDAPREKVWQAWTDTETFRKWMGPKGFTADKSTIDPVVGGKVKYCMTDPAGKDYYGVGTFVEILPMDKLSYIDSFADENWNPVPAAHYGMPDFPMETIVTVVLEDAEEGNGDKTKMTVTHSGMPEGDISDQTKQGWEQSFDKMAEIFA